jgi:hypothetical protein
MTCIVPSENDSTFGRGTLALDNDDRRAALGRRAAFDVYVLKRVMVWARKRGRSRSPTKRDAADLEEEPRRSASSSSSSENTIAFSTGWAVRAPRAGDEEAEAAAEAVADEAFCKKDCYQPCQTKNAETKKQHHQRTKREKEIAPAGYARLALGQLCRPRDPSR